LEKGGAADCSQGEIGRRVFRLEWGAGVKGGGNPETFLMNFHAYLAERYAIVKK